MSKQIYQCAGDPPRNTWHTYDELKAAAGLSVYYEGLHHCRVCANYSGWITAIYDNGVIIQAWAGDFTGTQRTEKLNRI